MKVTRHIALSAGLSLLLYRVSGSLRMAVSSFLAGVLWDLDHLADYLAQYGIPWNLKTFFRRFYEGEIPRVVLFLHSWELVVALLGYSLFRRKYIDKGRDSSVLPRNYRVLTGVLLGAIVHMVSDQIVNRPRSRAYFFLYRLCRGFSHPHMFPK